MSSSTSSSSLGPAGKNASARLPGAAQLRALIIALLLSLPALIGWESWLQTLETEDAQAPALEWAVRYDESRPDTFWIAFCGTSRIQYGISPVDVADELGMPRDHVLNFGVSGNSGMAIAEFIAADPYWRDGIVVIEIHVALDFVDSLPPPEVDDIVAQLGRARLFRLSDNRLRLAWSNSLKLASHKSTPLALTGFLQRRIRGIDEPRFGGDQRLMRSQRADRSAGVFHKNGWREIPGDASPRDGWAKRTRDIAELYSTRGNPLTDADLGIYLDRMHRLAEACRAKGITLVLLRLPAARVVLAVEKRKIPRKAYWDRISARFDHSIHFEDHAGLRDLDLPDGSHLGGASARRFSRAVARLLPIEPDHEAPR